MINPLIITAQEPSPPRVEHLDQLGGRVNATLPLGNNTVLIAQGETLLLASVTGELLHTEERFVPGYGYIQGMEQSGSVIYILTEEGIITFDRSLTFLGFTPGGGERLDLKPPYLLVSAKEHGVRIYQLGDDGLPATFETFTPDQPVEDVLLSETEGEFYLATGTSLLQILHNDSEYTLVQERSFSHPVERLERYNALILVGGGNRLSFYDPFARQTVGIYSPLEGGSRLIVEEEFAYIADRIHGLRIMWMADADRPIQIYGDTGLPAGDVEQVGNFLYIAGDNAFRIMDVGNRYRPLVLGATTLNGFGEGLSVTEDRAFIATGETGIAIVSIANRSQPTLIRQIRTDGPAHNALFAEGWIYVPTDSAGLTILSAGQSGSESLHTTIPLGCPALDIARRGNILFIPCGTGGLLALDITRPDQPTLLDSLPADFGDVYQSIHIEGKRAYISTGQSFVVIDINRPYDLGRLVRIEAPTNHIGFNGTYLYALSDDSIRTYDARATADPLLLSQYGPFTAISDMTVSGDRVFLANGGIGTDTVILSAASTSFPVELDRHGDHGFTTHIIADNDGFWLSAGEQGVFSAQLTQGGVVIPQGNYPVIAGAEHLDQAGSRLVAAGGQAWISLMVEGDILQPLSGGGTDNPIVRITANSETLITLTGDNRLTAFDITTGNVIATASAPAQTNTLAMDEQLLVIGTARGLQFYRPRTLIPMLEIITPSPVRDMQIKEESIALLLASGELALIEKTDPTGGIHVTAELEVRRPADLIPAPEPGIVYSLSENGILRLDISDPSRIRHISTGTLPSPATEGFFDDDYLVAHLSGEGYTFYDLTFFDENIIPRGQIAVSAKDLLLNSRIAYVAYGEDGFGVIDITQPGSGDFLLEETVNTLYRDGKTLYTLGERLIAWSLDENGIPIQQATLDLPSQGQDLLFTSTGTLLLSLQSGLAEISWNGDTLFLTQVLSISGGVDQITELGGNLYADLGSGGLGVVERTESGELFHQFTYSDYPSIHVHDLLPLDDRHLMVSWENQIEILDIGGSGELPDYRVELPHTQLEYPPQSFRSFEEITTFIREDSVSIYPNGIFLPPGYFETTGLDAYFPASFVHSPGTPLATTLAENILALADGICGIHFYDLSDPTNPLETGNWTGVFSGDVLSVSDNRFVVADAGGITLLRVHPDGDVAGPPLPQYPSPAHNTADVILNPTLSWGSVTDDCQPYTYEVYFGIGDDLPLVATGLTETTLQPGTLDPFRTYRWRVEVTDPLGNRVIGPTWQFSTTSADIIDSSPDSSPIFWEWVLDHPGISISLVALTVVALGLGYSTLRKKLIS